MNYELKDIKTSKFFLDPTETQFLQKFNYNVHKVTMDGELEDVDKRVLYTYIAITYDVNGLVKEVPELWRRKREAAITSGFKRKRNGKFEPVYEKIILGGFPEINTAIARYTARQNNPKWTALISLSELMERYQKMIFDPATNPSELRNLHDAINKIQANIDVYLNEMFGKTESIEVIEALYADIEKKRVELRNEDIARKLSKDEDPLDGYDPYNEEDEEQYKISKMKFISDEEPK